MGRGLFRSDRAACGADQSRRQHTLPLTATMRAIIEGRERRPGKEHIFGRPSNGGFSGWGESKAALDARTDAAGIRDKVRGSITICEKLSRPAAVS